jgi:hypothetical protein
MNFQTIIQIARKIYFNLKDIFEKIKVSSILFCEIVKSYKFRQ